MKRVFKDFANYVKLHNGVGKPRINFQEMYRMFPNFEFTPTRRFGEYDHFGEAYENKIYDMIVSDENGNECFLTYREYYDANENMAYCEDHVTR